MDYPRFCGFSVGQFNFNDIGMINLEVSDRQLLIALLKELPELATERSRQQILQLAGLGELAPRINLGGQTLIAVNEIVSYLSRAC